MCSIILVDYQVRARPLTNPCHGLSQVPDQALQGVQEKSHMRNDARMRRGELSREDVYLT